MPNCNIIGCGIKRNGNHPNLTLHQLPANKGKRKIWLEAIGVENLKMSTKTIHICSHHFEESCFNRTLNKITLRDDALPSRTLMPVIQSNMSVVLIGNNQDHTYSQSKSGCDALNTVKAVCGSTIKYQPVEISKRSGIDFDSSTSATLDLVTSTSAVPELGPSSSAAPGLASSTSAAPDFSVHTINIITKLKDKCQKQKKKLKSLYEKVRRQKKKIAHFSNIIKDLRERNLLNSESQALLAECAGPQDFIKRQVAKIGLQRQVAKKRLQSKVKKKTENLLSP